MFVQQKPQPLQHASSSSSSAYLRLLDTDDETSLNVCVPRKFGSRKVRRHFFRHEKSHDKCVRQVPEVLHCPRALDFSVEEKLPWKFEENGTFCGVFVFCFVLCFNNIQQPSTVPF